MGIQSLKFGYTFPEKSESLFMLASPPQFHQLTTFNTLKKFKGKLTEFHDRLHKEVNKAREYWREILAEEFEMSLSEIFRESERDGVRG